MPSKSYIDFLELLEDVNKLRETHYKKTYGKVGRKKLGFLTRSAVVMLCAAWERYNENLLLEIIDKIIASNIRAKSLPKNVKRFISSKVRDSRNEIYPIELADDGWINLWKGYATNQTDLLHTPNSTKLNLLFKNNLGIENYHQFWINNSKETIDQFVIDRGEIAHNGSKAKYIRITSLNKYIDLIIDNIIEIDSNIAGYLLSNYSISAWNKKYYRSLEDFKKQA